MHIQQVTQYIKQLFGDNAPALAPNFDPPAELEVSFSMDAVNPGEGKLLVITNIACDNLKGTVNFLAVDGTELFTQSGDGAKTDSGQIALICKSIDSVGMAEDSAPVKILFYEYTLPV